MTLRAALLASLIAATPAQALTFNFSTVPGDTLTPGQAAAFQAAADVWSSYLADAITVNLTIGFAALGPAVLAATTPTLLVINTGGARTLLAADATSGTDTMAVATLATSTQPLLVITSAQAKAIGATIGSNVVTDGKIEFSTSFSFSETRNGSGGVAPGTFDLVGIAEHEIGHMLGFVSGVDLGGGFQTLLDQFRYGSPGTRSLISGASAYFSVDQGVTSLANFATGVGNQASHWLPGTLGVMVPEVAPGNVQNISALDVKAFDTIGFDVTVPEPASLAVLGGGLALLFVGRRAGGRMPSRRQAAARLRHLVRRQVLLQRR